MGVFCKYKNIFGNEGEGVHAYRVFNLAIVDVFFTVVAAFLWSKYMKLHVMYSLVLFFLLAIIAHRIFCVNTTVNKAIFGEV